MMHSTFLESRDFAQMWENDVPTFAAAVPCPYEVGDTIKTYETDSGVTTGRYVLATVTGVADISPVFVNVSQTIFQRAIQ